MTSSKSSIGWRRIAWYMFFFVLLDTSKGLLVSWPLGAQVAPRAVGGSLGATGAECDRCAWRRKRQRRMKVGWRRKEGPWVVFL